MLTSDEKAVLSLTSPLTGRQKIASIQVKVTAYLVTKLKSKQFVKYGTNKIKLT
jgi:hypothetical protein